MIAWLRRLFALVDESPSLLYRCPKCGLSVYLGDIIPPPKLRYCGTEQKAPRCDEQGEHLDYYNTCARCGFEDQWRQPLPALDRAGVQP